MNRLGLAVCLLVAAPTVASAHIHMLQPKSRTDNPTGDQKDQHCGTVGYSRAANPGRITTFRPGQTIRVMWRETINHPGWYRISFQPNGEIFYIPPPVGNGGFPTENRTGQTDTPSGSIILLDRIADGVVGTTQMADVTLPNIECNNCTLQFTQFMSDKAPYTADALSDDIYFNCADLILSNAAPTTPDASPMVDAGVDAPGFPSDGRTAQGGCSVATGKSGGVAVLALLGALLGRRRRRRS